MDKKVKTWPLPFPAKKNPNMEKALFDWPIVLQYDVRAKYGLISRKFLGFFHPSVCLTNQPIKSLYFRSFVVSVLFASFHFKVIQKSLYSGPKKEPSVIAWVFRIIYNVLIKSNSADINLHLSPWYSHCDHTVFIAYNQVYVWMQQQQQVLPLFQNHPQTVRE